MSLSDASIGFCGTVRALKGPDFLVERLYEIGVVPGEAIRLERKMPFGDPYIVEVRGVSIALEKSEAGCIEV